MTFERMNLALCIDKTRSYELAEALHMYEIANLMYTQMTRTQKMKDIVRNELFPTAEMIVTMSREFGVPFTQKDFEGEEDIYVHFSNGALHFLATRDHEFVPY